MWTGKHNRVKLCWHEDLQFVSASEAWRRNCHRRAAGFKTKDNFNFSNISLKNVTTSLNSSVYVPAQRRLREREHVPGNLGWKTNKVFIAFNLSNSHFFNWLAAKLVPTHHLLRPPPLESPWGTLLGRGQSSAWGKRTSTFTKRKPASHRRTRGLSLSILTSSSFHSLKSILKDGMENCWLTPRL